ncbi:MAG: lytic transglycosylase domain-containing protein [Candidatus Moraniibacteriota bacterium]|nr:MAG: lytic transglycosylase domain-containing protein [Candidatus Moranbacteria bacterium]
MRASVTPVVDFPQTGAFDAIQSIDLDNLPTSRLPIPAWMTRERNLPLAMPAISSAPAGCDGAQYVPAWWLSKAAEARRAYYFPTMAAIACEAGIPTLLFDALITQESGYNPLAVSSAGAAGLSQIIPDTARYLGLLTPFEPVANMKAGARYLREQLIRFGGRSDLALAAYNAGPGRVQKKWAVPRIRETVNYVNVITLNWSRLATMQQPSPDFIDRGQLAAAVVDSFPYRRATFLNFSAR